MLAFSSNARRTALLFTSSLFTYTLLARSTSVYDIIYSLDNDYCYVPCTALLVLPINTISIPEQLRCGRVFSIIRYVVKWRDQRFPVPFLLLLLQLWINP